MLDFKQEIELLKTKGANWDTICGALLSLRDQRKEIETKEHVLRMLDFGIFLEDTFKKYDIFEDISIGFTLELLGRLSLTVSRNGFLLGKEIRPEFFEILEKNTKLNLESSSYEFINENTHLELKEISGFTVTGNSKTILQSTLKKLVGTKILTIFEMDKLSLEIKKPSTNNKTCIKV